MTESGIEQRVHPAMVPKHSAIAEVSGVTNCVAIDGDYCGNLLLAGAGAGGNATASAVAGDILDIARGDSPPPFGVPGGQAQAPTSAPSWVSTRAPTMCASPCLRSTQAPWPASPDGWASAEVSLESIVQRRPRGAQIGIGARPKPGAPDHRDPHHAPKPTEEAIRECAGGDYRNWQRIGAAAE